MYNNSKHLLDELCLDIVIYNPSDFWKIIDLTVSVIVIKVQFTVTLV